MMTEMNNKEATMKLSKSKLALAKVINENGGWHDNDTWLFSTQSGDGVLKFWKAKPKAQKGCVCTEWSGGCRLNFALSRVIQNWHQTILSREEYHHAYPKADADGWIEWKGGECPVEAGTNVDVKYRDGRENFHVKAMSYDRTGSIKSLSATCWGSINCESDIVAYRLHKPEVKPEFCESVMRSIPEPKPFKCAYDPRIISLANVRIIDESIDDLCAKATEENKHQHIGTKPTIEQLAADYRNASDSADRKQQEADDAKADAEAKLEELIAAGSALGLALSVETEGSVITPSHPPIIPGDWSSWHQWEVGDFISWSIVGHAGEFRIIAVHHDQSRNIGDFEVEDKHGGVYRVYGDECRFIRRP